MTPTVANHATERGRAPDEEVPVLTTLVPIGAMGVGVTPIVGGTRAGAPT